MGLLPEVPTPFYVFAPEPVTEGLGELDRALHGAGFMPAGSCDGTSTGFRHWLSCKTQPLPHLLRWWRRQGRPIEVVSAFELRAALTEGFPEHQILVNGPLKHAWLPPCARPGLRVNLDSPRELQALLPLAQRLRWSLGLRLNTRAEFDPEQPHLPTPFGMEPDAAMRAVRAIRRAGLGIDTVHCHLRTNLASQEPQVHALKEMAAFCKEARIQPRFVDLGGGLPPPSVSNRGGGQLAATFNLDAWAQALAAGLQQFPGTEELWLENGRFLTARAGVLVVRILDIKERRGLRQLLCDGGRTLHALVSTWEDHELFSIPARSGPLQLTAVHGPTCMAFDQMARRPLPRSLRVGDVLVWMDAGAYHLPWETRFSHGHAATFWHEDDHTVEARSAESFASWWKTQSGN
jgi:diaminopimelate decarboxylase